MHSAENLKGANRRTLSRSSYADEAIERGSPAAFRSALAVAIAVPLTLWFGHFASERARPAWEAIEREAILLRQEVCSFADGLDHRTFVPDSNAPTSVRFEIKSSGGSPR
jgi:hypothetical protein